MKVLELHSPRFSMVIYYFGVEYNGEKRNYDALLRPLTLRWDPLKLFLAFISFLIHDGQCLGHSYYTQTCTSQICRLCLPSFEGRMAWTFSLEKSRSLYQVIGPMWQKFICLSITHYSKTYQPIPLFGPRSSPFASSDGVFLQAKCSKIKERVEGWRSGKKLPFKRTTVCIQKEGYKRIIPVNFIDWNDAS